MDRPEDSAESRPGCRSRDWPSYVNPRRSAAEESADPMSEARLSAVPVVAPVEQRKTTEASMPTRARRRSGLVARSGRRLVARRSPGQNGSGPS
jgi:hypothetical protein